MEIANKQKPATSQPLALSEESSVGIFARIFQEPEIVIGSVTPRALAHPESQGRIGDGILTAYAPDPGSLMLSSDANGAYDYQYIDRSGSAVTSYGMLFDIHQVQTYWIKHILTIHLQRVE